MSNTSIDRRTFLTAGTAFGVCPLSGLAAMVASDTGTPCFARVILPARLREMAYSERLFLVDGLLFARLPPGCSGEFEVEFCHESSEPRVVIYRF